MAGHVTDEVQPESISTRRAGDVKLHGGLLPLFTLCMLLLVVVSAGAQEISLGSDGVDVDCDDFPERNAVEGCFTQNGGSGERNVDTLDPNGDGIPCNEEGYDGETDTDTGPESISADGTDTGDSGGADEPAAPVVRLPVTGDGSGDERSGAGLIALTVTLAAVMGAMLLSVCLRRTS